MEPLQAHVVDTYRRYAPVYDRLFGRVLQPGRDRLARAVHALAPSSLLEVGVGTGLLLPAYPRTAQVHGVDLSAEMLAQARERVEREQLSNVTLQRLDGERMPFPDGRFDCVTLPYVLSVTPEPARLVAEVRRVCRPGGSIVIVNHFSGSRFWWGLEKLVSPLARRIGFRSDFDFATHVGRHDWQVVSVEPVNLFGLSRLVVLRNG